MAVEKVYASNKQMEGGGVLGAVTANAGTNLNTSALALEATLQTVMHGTDSMDAKTPTMGSNLPSGSTPVIETAQHLGASGQIIAIGAASVRSAALGVGLWRISGSGDVWFRQGDNTVVASAAAGSSYLAAGAVECAVVATGVADGYIAIIRDGSETGNVSITKIGDVAP